MTPKEFFDKVVEMRRGYDAYEIFKAGSTVIRESS